MTPAPQKSTKMPLDNPDPDSIDPETFAVAPEHAGARLDRLLADQMPDVSRSRLQAWIESGHVLVNGEPSRASVRTRAGDVVSIRVPAPTPELVMKPEDVPLDILFEDEVLLVLNKPAGVVVHPGAGVVSGTLVNALLHHCGSLSVVGGVERPGIVHRLDKETSGCLLVAKSDVAHRALSRQFAERSVRKTYLAITTRGPRPASGSIDVPIARHPVHRQKMCASERAEARESRTDYQVLKNADGLYLVECRPLTGRTHQIRVHLQYVGSPVAGDPVYGKRDKFARHLLHAWKLEFTHPSSGERLAFASPVPSDFPLRPDEG